MNSPRRGLLSRIGVRSSNRRYRDLPEYVDRFEDDNDTASIDTALPAYSQYADEPYARPPSPAPTYNTVDIREVSHSEITTPQRYGPVHSALPKPQAAIDDIVNRLNESIKNPKAWRVKKDGQMSFFWALRCTAGTGRLLNNYIEEIKTRTLKSNEWKVERFCFIYKGQQLGTLWCRPIHPEVFIHL
jgi:hypothetical protein